MAAGKGGTLICTGKPIGFHRIARAIVRFTGRSAAPVSARTADGLETHDDGTTLKVLVVDDSEDSAGFVAAALQCHRHQVLMAHDGTSAIEICSRMQPGLVLLDIALPDIDGFAKSRSESVNTRGWTRRSLPPFPAL